MKTKISLLTLLLLSILLSACAISASQSQTTTANGTPQPGNNFGNAELPLVTQLAIGTLMLEGTEQAVTAEQAAELLTLWQAYQALSNSDTTAQAELDAVVKQIQGLMTAEQIEAIEAMNLTRQNMSEVMQSLGIDFAGRGSNTEGTPEAGRTFQGEGGMGPGGGMGRGGEMGGMEAIRPDMQTTPDASTQATMQARMQAQANQVNPMLLQALMEMLESK